MHAQEQSDRPAYSLIALILAAAVLAGFAVLPRLTQSANGLVGKPAPEFSVQVLNDNSQDRVRLSDLRGKAVVLSFWASWCSACQMEAPSLERLSRRMRDRNVVVLGLDTNDQPSRALAFIKSKGLSYTSAYDDGSVVADQYRVDSLPTVVIVDKNGVVTAVRTGLTDEATIESLVSGAM